MQRDTDNSTLEPLIEKLAYRAELDADDRAAIMALPFTSRTFERHQYVVVSVSLRRIRA